MDYIFLKVLSLLFLVDIALPLPLMCPQNWKDHNQHCYSVSDYGVKMTEAKEHCEDSKASLLSINSQDENDWITNLLSRALEGTSYWTGLVLHKNIEAGVATESFKWSDGSLPNESDKFIEWADGEPSNGTDEYCTEINHQGKFNDNRCDHKLQFICKKVHGCFSEFGGDGCAKCLCQDHGDCDPHYGNCTKGCDAQHLGFNCSTPLQIDKLFIKDVTSNSAILRWPVWNGTIINSSKGQAKITYQYIINNLNKSEPYKPPKDDGRKTMKRTIKKLEPATDYTICVTVNHDGMEQPCSEEGTVQFRTLCQDVPPSVENLQVAVMSRESFTDLEMVKVRLTWQVPESTLATCPEIERYRMFSRMNKTQEWTYHGRVNSFHFEGEFNLRIAEFYDFKVRTIDTTRKYSDSMIEAKYIEPKECFFRYKDMQKQPQRNCSLCRCLDDGICHKYFGNCSQGCSNDYIGFNCRTDFIYPSKPSIKHVSDTTATITWKGLRENQNSDKGLAKIVYGIKIKKGGAIIMINNVTSSDVAFDDHEETVTNLEPSSDYTACIALFREGVSGPCRQYKQFKTLCKAPTRPVTLNLTSEVGPTQVNMTLKYISVITNPCDILTHYSVHHHKVNSNNDSQEDGRPSGQTIQHKLSLEPNTTHSIMLEVFNKDNMSSFSWNYWLDFQGLNQSTKLKVVSLMTRSAKLEWQPKITKWPNDYYKVSCRSQKPNDIFGIIMISISEQEYPFIFEFTNLEPGTNYACQINDEQAAQIIFLTKTGSAFVMTLEHATIAGSCSFVGLLLILLVVIIVAIKCKRKKKSQDELKYEECIHDVDLATYRQERASLAGSLASLDTIDEPIYANHDAYTRPPPVSEHLQVSGLLEYIRKKVQERSFQAEYKGFRFDAQHECTAARKSENSLKNRFKNISAYDKSRVILTDITPGGTDYINASYIKGHDKQICYIASQGPVPASIADMWEMIWQEEVTKIVMLTGFLEAGKKRCSHYFEADGTNLYGNISVRVMETVEEPAYELRTMKVIKGKVQRFVHHFHFTAWPDHGVPSHPAPVLHLREAVNNQESTEGLDGPIVVHCSAGVGRTGTYIAIDYLIKQAEATGTLDFVRCTKELRDARIRMIQTLNQYIFIHFAVLEHLVLGNTSIATPDFQQTLENLVTKRQWMGATKLELQFEVLQLSVREDIIQSIENLAEDRLHPVFIPNTKSKLTFIALQSPSANTKEEFLDLIRQYSVKLIVTLECKRNSENFFSNKNLSLISIDDMDDFRVRDFDFLERGMTRRIKQIFFKAWGGDNGLPGIPVLASFIEKTQSMLGDQETANVIVHCKNGTTRCGLFCTAYVIYKRIQKVPSEVNIYQAIRYIKNSQPAFVENVEQYIHLHELVKESLAKLIC